MSKRFFYFFLLLCTSVLVPAVHGQQAPAVTIPATHQYELHADANDTDYRLFVALPQGYAASDSVDYPVLYLLDGNDGFPLVTSTYRMLRLQQEVPDLIIVGVGYPVDTYMETFAPRWTDYTASHVAATDSVMTAERGLDGYGIHLRSGGGEAFLQFLREEAIPFVEGSYRTSDDRAIWGHSLGGLFAAYALFQAPGLFDRYGISSPSLWWDDGSMFAQETAYAAEEQTLPARLFFSVGADEGEQMVQLVQRFTEALRGRDYQGLVLQSHVFEDETHTSVIPAAVSRSLRFLYGQE